MPQVRMRAATYSVDHGRLAAGQLVEAEDDVAKRWLKNGLAADKDDKDAQAALAQSTEGLQAEIQRLQAELARAQAGQGEEQPTPADQGPYTAQDELRDFGFLTEQQRANLTRAGFGSRQQLAEAREEDLLEVDGVGAATVTRLQEAAQQSSPFGTDAGDKAITRGPGGR